jgi:hypothetical protein
VYRTQTPARQSSSPPRDDPDGETVAQTLPAASPAIRDEASQPVLNSQALGEDYRRFQKLPPKDIQDAIIDQYFASCEGQPYSLFHEPLFRQRLGDGRIPEYLLFAVLATGLRHCSIGSLHGYQSDAIEQYTKQSWKIIVKEWNQLDGGSDLDLTRAVLLHSVIDFTSMLLSN